MTTTASGLGFAGAATERCIAFDTATGHQLWSFQTGHQIAAGASIYEDHGKEFVAITVGGTPTSSFGGTASQLQVFALDAISVQSTAPQLRPQIGARRFLRAADAVPPLSSEPHTVSVLAVVVFGPHGDPNIDGTSHGGMTVIVPPGSGAPTSRSATCDGCPRRALPWCARRLGPRRRHARLRGATSSGSTAGVGYSHFTASASAITLTGPTVASRAAGGEWIPRRRALDVAAR